MSQLDVNQVIQEHFARVHRAALVMTGNPWDADDLTQETFLVLAKSLDAFQGRSHVYTWLYGILVNLERRERRRHGVRQRKLRVLREAPGAGDRTVPEAEAAIEVSEWKRSLWSQVARLPDGQRQSLVLRFSESLQYDEIAEILNCPLGTVKSRIHHGLNALRQMMKDAGDETKLPPDHPFEDVNYETEFA